MVAQGVKQAAPVMTNTLRDMPSLSELQHLSQQSQQGAAIDPTRFMPPPSDFVKRQTCAFCGAPKQLPSVREFLYCDFCGQLLDYDLRVASTSAYANPISNEYVTLANDVGPASQRAVEAGDRERFLQLRTSLCDAQTRYTPWAVPPRAWNDESYRSQWIRFQAESAAATMFDPEYKRLTDEVTSRALSIRWVGGNMFKMAQQAMGGAQSADAFPQADPDTFWPMVDVLLAQHERAKQVISAAGLRELDPDQSPDSLNERMLRSMIVQGWMTRLPDEAAVELIDRLEISHQYLKPEITADRKGCGGCGGTMHVAPGARQVVCDGCGRKLDLGSGELECTGCGGHIVVPEAQNTGQCSFCRAEVRRI